MGRVREGRGGAVHLWLAKLLWMASISIIRIKNLIDQAEKENSAMQKQVRKNNNSTSYNESSMYAHVVPPPSLPLTPTSYFPSPHSHF